MDTFYTKLKIQEEDGSNAIFKLALNVFEKRISFGAAYEFRAKFHYDNFIDHNKQPEGSILLNCETSVMQVVLRLFENTPSCIIIYECTQCLKQDERNIVAPIVYISDIKDGQLDITQLTDLSMTTRCRERNCEGRRRASISHLGYIVIFEFNADREYLVKLDALPKIFENPLDTEANYRLVGAVAYKQLSTMSRRSSTDKGTGHFKALCLRGTQWVEYDDLKDVEKSQKPTLKINVQILVYVKTK